MDAQEKVQFEITRLRKLLEIEKVEDRERFRLMVMNKKLPQRVEEGLSWYPLQVLKTGFMIGDRAFVIVQASKQNPQNQIRTGNIVSLFSNSEIAEDRATQGVVNYVDGPKMKIVLYSRDLPEWLGLGQMGVDMVFDDRTYREMDDALQQLAKAKGNRLAELRDVSFGVIPPSRIKPQTNIVSAALNPSQQAAMQTALGVEDFSVIHGPPGTGKTTTVVELVYELAQQKRSVLLSTPSNTAADLLTERLDNRGVSVVRLGNVSRVHESLLQLTLEGQLAQHPDYKQLGKLKVQAAELRRRASKESKSFASGRANFRELMQEARDLEGWSNELERRLLDDILENAQAIVCTLTGAGLNILSKREFEIVIIDEASQALEPATWIPISKGKRIILTGDPYQLPPTVKSMEAAKGGLNVTLLDRLITRLDHTSLLTLQYRMHPEIMGFSNQLFYKGALQAAHTIGLRAPLPVHAPAMLFIDTAGCGFEEKENETQHSKFNPEEFYILREHLYQYLKALPEEAICLSIGIISPYREQVAFIKTAILEDEVLKNRGIEVQSIDGFQGQERDIIYLSLVRSNTKQEIGFLSDARRLNVALTRAKHHLIIVGDSATIASHALYGDLLSYCEGLAEGYTSAWAYMEY